jgi:hypothetical protein
MFFSQSEKSVNFCAYQSGARLPMFLANQKSVNFAYQSGAR